MGTRLLALFPWNLHCFTARWCGYKEGPEPLAVSCDHLFPLLCYLVCSGAIGAMAPLFLREDVLGVRAVGPCAQLQSPF